MNKSISNSLLLIAALPIVASCSKSNASDIAATVNGSEITSAEVYQELATGNIKDAPTAEQKNAALQTIINRKLLINLAKDNKLDRTPEFIAQSQRMEDLLKAQTASSWLVKGNSEPEQSDIDNYLRSHPEISSSRTIFQINSLQFSKSTPEVVAKLKTAHTMDQIGAIAAEAGIAVARAPLQWDSASLPPELVQKLRQLPAGEPFIIEGKGNLLAGVIAGTQDKPLDNEQAQKLAKQLLMQQAINKRMSSWLDEAMGKAKITYGQGFGPLPKANAGKKADSKAPKP